MSLINCFVQVLQVGQVTDASHRVADGAATTLFEGVGHFSAPSQVFEKVEALEGNIDARVNIETRKSVIDANRVVITKHQDAATFEVLNINRSGVNVGLTLARRKTRA